MWWLEGLPPTAGRALAVALLFLVGLGMWFWRGRGGAAPATGEPGAEETRPAAGRPAEGRAAEAGRVARETGPVAAETGPGGGTARAARWLLVHVVGAVQRPGVYRLLPDARVQDAVYAAGGAARGGRPDVLNLAAPLEDGMRVYVPSAEEVRRQGLSPGETWPAGAGGGVPVGRGTGTGGDGRRGTGRVDINRAGEAELDALPGIGPALAGRIVAHRQVHGPFRRAEDLLQVPGIGPAKLEALRPLLVFR